MAPTPKAGGRRTFRPSQSKVKRRRPSVLDFFTSVQTPAEQALFWQLQPDHTKGKTVNWRTMAKAWNQEFARMPLEHARDLRPKGSRELEQYGHRVALQLGMTDRKRFARAVQALTVLPGQVHALAVGMPQEQPGQQPPSPIALLLAPGPHLLQADTAQHLAHAQLQPTCLPAMHTAGMSACCAERIAIRDCQSVV